jgi:serine/alanine racemase
LLGTWTVLLFVGRRGQLWYLGASVLAVIVLSLLIKSNIPLKYIVLISVFLYAIGMLGDSYYGFIIPLRQYCVPDFFISVYGTLFSTTRNGLFFGLIFVLIGALFAQKKIVINNVLAISGFAMSMILMFIEVYLIRNYSHPRDFNMVIFLLPVVFFLFYIATHIELQNRPIYKSLRVIGMIVFFTHQFVNFFVKILIEKTYSIAGIDISGFEFVLTVIFAIILGIIIDRLSGKEKFQWLKYLTS